MSSERGRVVAIFVVLALIGGAAGFYFFKIYRPKQVKAAAQDEITAWETRFQAARDCLLGQKPGSAKTSEALAIREMAPDPWDRGKCTPLMGKLSRGEAPDSGLPEVEVAWKELEQAAAHAAASFATHVASSTTLKQDPLPAALDELDDARGKLRAAAGMPATEQVGKPLAQAKLLPLVDGNDPLIEVTVDTVPSAHGMVVFGRTSQHIQIALSPGKAPVLSKVGEGNVLRGVPDPSWGASVVGSSVGIGAMNDTGAIATPSVQQLPNATVAAVLGTAADGEVVYGNADQLIVARSKAGAVTTDPPIKIITGSAALDADGRAAAIWRDPKGQTFGRVLAPGHDQDVVELGTGPINSTCLTDDRVWMSSASTLIGWGGGKPVVRRELGYKIPVGCTGDAMLLREHDPRTPLTICTDDCRAVPMPTGAPEFSATTVVNGKLVAVASHGGVLGVWREGSAPVFYGLPEIASPVMAHEWPAMVLTDGKVLDVLARGAKSFVIIRVPAA